MPLMAGSGHPGMQQETGPLRHLGAVFFQTALRWQILQAKGLTALLRTERDATGNGTAKRLRKAFLITRLQREVTVVHIARQQPLARLRPNV